MTPELLTALRRRERGEPLTAEQEALVQANDAALNAVIEVLGKLVQGEPLNDDEQQLLNGWRSAQDRMQQERAQRRRRLKLSPIGRALDDSVKRMRASKHQFVHANARMIDALLDVLAEGRPIEGPFDAAKLAAVEHICAAVGGELPATPWPKFADEVGVSLSLFFADEARYAAARAAYEGAQRRRRKWKSRKESQRAAERQAAYERALRALDDANARRKG